MKRSQLRRIILETILAQGDINIIALEAYLVGKLGKVEVLRWDDTTWENRADCRHGIHVYCDNDDLIVTAGLIGRVLARGQAAIEKSVADMEWYEENICAVA